MEIALGDFDSDGSEDVAVTFRSLFGCGSHGCETRLFHARGGFFSRTAHYLVTDGPVARCRRGSMFGVAFPGRGKGFACFDFPGPPLWSNKDVDPRKSLHFEGKLFALLEGAALRSTVYRHSIQATPCNDSSQCVQWFHERGQFGQSEDRGIGRGTYRFGRDRYCAALGDYRFCAAVYQSRDGELAMTNLKCGPPCLTIVRGDPGGEATSTERHSSTLERRSATFQNSLTFRSFFASSVPICSREQIGGFSTCELAKS